jgi:hypothetical protein
VLAAVVLLAAAEGMTLYNRGRRVVGVVVQLVVCAVAVLWVSLPVAVFVAALIPFTHLPALNQRARQNGQRHVAFGWDVAALLLVGLLVFTAIRA